MPSFWRSLGKAFLLVLVASGPAWAQFAGLTGTVTDPSGALVPGATVKITHEGTGAVRSTTTGPNGVYLFAQVPPSNYRVEVTMQGFRTSVHQHVALPAAITSTFNVQLEIGALAEQVVVEGSVAALNTTDASMGNVVSGTQVLNLPTLNLDPTNLLSLAPGVTFVPGQGETPGGYSNVNDFDFRGGSVNGSRSDQTNITLDGVDVNDPQNGYAFTSVLRATQASLQEFRVTTTNYNADQGRSSAAQIQLVTKSGTNDIHGLAYWAHRNEAANANDFFLNEAGQAKPKFRRHIYGLAVGGPVVKDRFFLFGNWEELKEAVSTSTQRDIPSMAFRDGVMIYECADSGACPGNTAQGVSGASWTADPGFYALSPGELAAIDPLGIGPNPAILSYFQGYPVPNASGTFDALNIRGLRFGVPVDNEFRTWIARADLNIDRAAKHTVYWRGTLQDDTLVRRGPQFPGDPPNQGQLGSSKGFALGYNAVLGATAVNTFRWGLTRIKEETAGLKTQPFVDLRFIADIEGGEIGAGADANSFGRALPQHHLRDDFSWTRGSHTFGLGTEIRYTRNDRFTNASSFHGFFTNPSWLPNVGRNVTPGAPSCAQAGCDAVPAVSSAFASAYRDSVVNLLGIITQATASYNFDRTGATLPANEPVFRKFGVDEYEIYFQDQWRATPTLTLTGGVRWYISSPPWERNGNQVVPILVDPATGNPVPGVLGDWFNIRRDLMLAGSPSNNAPQIEFALGGPVNNAFGYYDWDLNDFSPRAAVAWAPRFTDGVLGKLLGDGKTVIRGGYSLVYDRIGNGLATSFDSGGSFGMSTVIDSLFGGCDEGIGTAPLGACPRYTGVFDTAAATSALLPPSPGGSFPSIPPGADEFGFALPGSFAITQAIDGGISTPYAHMINFSISRRLPWDLSVEAAYVGRRGRDLLIINDLAMPADLCDPNGGGCYFENAQELIRMFEAGVDINDVGPIAYFESLFPSFGPNGINGGFLACGVAPGSDFNTSYSATQVAYDWMNCLEGDYTVFPWAIDQFGFPGYVLGGPGAQDVDGDGIPDSPFAFFDDQFADLQTWQSIGRSEYHAFQLVVRKQLSQGIAFDFNYTLSKSLDHTSTPERADIFFGFFNGGYSGSVINAWNPDLEYSFSDFDMRHQLNTNWYVELPFGHGKAFGSDLPGWANHILGGWQVSGIFRWNSGLPANVINDRIWPTNWDLQGNAPCQPAGGALFGSQLGPCPSTQNVHNTTGDDGPNLFRDPDEAIRHFRFGMPGERGNRNILRGDGYVNLDFALGKTFQMPWHESHRLVFRWEMFNVTNSPYFDTVSLDADLGSSGTFGNYNEVLGGPRQMQFTLRYEF